jgi:hypothetical protein
LERNAGRTGALVFAVGVGGVIPAGKGRDVDVDVDVDVDERRAAAIDAGLAAMGAGKEEAEPTAGRTDALALAFAVSVGRVVPAGEGRDVEEGEATAIGTDAAAADANFAAEEEAKE